jgi:hypothetical protein
VRPVAADHRQNRFDTTSAARLAAGSVSMRSVAVFGHGWSNCQSPIPGCQKALRKLVDELPKA